MTEGFQIFDVDEASVSLTSFVGTTYAPRGQRPVLTISTEITRRLYVVSGISASGDLLYHCREKPFDAHAIIAFLQQMLTAYEGRLLIIWDNASIHDCAATRTFLTTDAHAGRLHLVKQPTYTPEVNADEQVWHQLKCVSLKNTCAKTLQELRLLIIAAMDALQQTPALIKQFFHHPAVAFYN